MKEAAYRCVPVRPTPRFQIVCSRERFAGCAYCLVLDHVSARGDEELRLAGARSGEIYGK